MRTEIEQSYECSFTTCATWRFVMQGNQEMAARLKVYFETLADTPFLSFEFRDECAFLAKILDFYIHAPLCFFDVDLSSIRPSQ